MKYWNETNSWKQMAAWKELNQSQDFFYALENDQ